MSKNEWKKLLGAVGRMLLAYALVFAQGAWATQNQGTKDKSASSQKAAAAQANEKQSSVATSAKEQSQQTQVEESESSEAVEKSPGDASHQSIKVHGHWTIEVKNPDGTLVKHVEFENSLDSNGKPLLSRILARQATVSHWQIALGGPGGGGGPCLDAGGMPANCIIAEPEPNGACPSTNGGLTCPASNVLPTLNAPTVDANGNLVLSGQATAAVNSSVGAVYTRLHVCNSTISPATTPCPYTIGQDFVFMTDAFATTTSGVPSSPSFTAPIPVSVGQLIAVTVVISFS